jgi:hypothetical protein
MTRIARRLEPNPDHEVAYAATYRAYRQLHPAIGPIIRDLAGDLAAATT